MKVKFTFRNVPPSDGLRSYAKEKLERLDRLFHTPLTAEVTVSKERHEYKVDVIAQSSGFRFNSSEVTEDSYASMETAVDRIVHQVNSRKGKRDARRRNKVAAQAKAWDKRSA